MHNALVPRWGSTATADVPDERREVVEFQATSRHWSPSTRANAVEEIAASRLHSQTWRAATSSAAVMAAAGSERFGSTVEINI